MLIDTFLFFQELDLQEIRLKYLSPYIDKFIIVESCTIFKGDKKAYNFEKYKKGIIKKPIQALLMITKLFKSDIIYLSKKRIN